MQPRDVHAVLGGPGTGKSYVVKLVVRHALLTRKIRVVVLTPTGCLHKTYRRELAYLRMQGLPVYFDTYHAYFEIHKGGPMREDYDECKQWMQFD